MPFPFLPSASLFPFLYSFPFASFRSLSPSFLSPCLLPHSATPPFSPRCPHRNTSWPLAATACFLTSFAYCSSRRTPHATSRARLVHSGVHDRVPYVREPSEVLMYFGSLKLSSLRSTAAERSRLLRAQALVLGYEVTDGAWQTPLRPARC